MLAFKPRYIVSEESSGCTSVVAASDRAKSLLAGCIPEKESRKKRNETQNVMPSEVKMNLPYLKLYRLVIHIDHFAPEFNADCMRCVFLD
jgi:hypothetical protein